MRNQKHEYIGQLSFNQFQQFPSDDFHSNSCPPLTSQSLLSSLPVNPPTCSSPCSNRALTMHEHRRLSKSSLMASYYRGICYIGEGSPCHLDVLPFKEAGAGLPFPFTKPPITIVPLYIPNIVHERCTCNPGTRVGLQGVESNGQNRCQHIP